MNDIELQNMLSGLPGPNFDLSDLIIKASPPKQWQALGTALTQCKNLHGIDFSLKSIDMLNNFTEQSQAFISALAQGDNLHVLTLRSKKYDTVRERVHENRLKMICAILAQCKSLHTVDLKDYDATEDLSDFLLKNSSITTVILNENDKKSAKTFANKIFHNTVYKGFDSTGSVKYRTLEELKELLSLARRSYLLFGESGPCEYMMTMLGGDFRESEEFKSNLKDFKMNKSNIEILIKSDDNVKFDKFLQSLSVPRLILAKTFERKNLEDIQKLVSNIISNGQQDDVDAAYGKTILMYACEFGDRELVKTILAANVNVNTVDTRGRSALMYAVQNPDNSLAAEYVKLLIEHGAEIDVPSNIHDFMKPVETPLSIAIKTGKEECVKLLSPIVEEHKRSDSQFTRTLRYFGAFLFKIISLPFRLIQGMVNSVWKNTEIGLKPTDTLKSKVTFDVPQHDAEFDQFAQDIKNHVADTFKKASAVVAQQKATNQSNTKLLESILKFKLVFDKYNFDNYSHSRDHFFTTASKYIEFIKPHLDMLDREFNSIELPQVATANSILQQVDLTFSQTLKSNNLSRDLNLLDKELGKLYKIKSPKL